MTFSELQTPEPVSPTLIVVSWGSHSSIKYIPSPTGHIYIITNPSTFLDYIRTLIFESPNDIVVVPIFSKFKQLLPFLKFLNQFDANETYRSRYAERYQSHLKQIHSQHDPNLPVSFGPGQYQIPLAVELIILIDPKHLEQDHMAAKSIVLQQYLRFIALQHGGSVASTDVAQLLQDPQRLFHMDHGPKPIFDGTTDPSTTSDSELPLYLMIPSAWDTWAKIILLAKSSIFQDNSRVILDDASLQHSSQLYDDYFNSEKDESQLQTLLLKIDGPAPKTPESPTEISLSFNDILHHASSTL